MAKKAVKKTTVKKVAPKAAKKVAAKKAAPTKVAPTKTAVKAAPKKVVVKKTATKKTAVKKTAAPKAATKATPVTTIIGRVDVGFGNALYIRGDGPGLSWDKGVIMGNASAEEWVWSTAAAVGEITFKVLINDEYWSSGLNSIVGAGERVVVEPAF